MEKEFYTSTECAAIFGMSHAAWLRQAKQGKVPRGERFSPRIWLWLREEIDRLAPKAGRMEQVELPCAGAGMDDAGRDEGAAYPFSMSAGALARGLAIMLDGVWLRPMASHAAGAYEEYAASLRLKLLRALIAELEAMRAELESGAA